MKPVSFSGGVFYAQGIPKDDIRRYQPQLGFVACREDCDIFVYNKTPQDKFHVVIAKDGSAYQRVMTGKDIGLMWDDFSRNGDLFDKNVIINENDDYSDY